MPSSHQLSNALHYVVAGDPEGLEVALSSMQEEEELISTVLNHPFTSEALEQAGTQRKARCFEGDTLLLISLFVTLCHKSDSSAHVEDRLSDIDLEDAIVAEERTKRLKIINMLLRYGATLPQPTHLSPHRIADAQSEVKAVQNILFRIVEVGASTLVHVASMCQYPFTNLEYTKQYSGTTLLHDAVWAEDLPMIQALLEVGCDYSTFDMQFGFIHQTPVHAAVSMFDVPILEIFFQFEERLRSGSDLPSVVNRCLCQNVPIRELVDESGVSLLGRAMFWAIDPQLHYNENQSKAIPCIEYLIYRKCPVPSKYTSSKVFDLKLPQAPLPLVTLLLEHGSDPAAIACDWPLAGLMPGVLEVLLDYGLEVCGQVGDTGGLTRLHISVANGEERVIKLLLANGAGSDLFTRDANGKRPVDMVRLPRQANIKAILEAAMAAHGALNI